MIANTTKSQDFSFDFENTNWVQTVFEGSYRAYKYFCKGDTTINGKTYAKLYRKYYCTYSIQPNYSGDSCIDGTSQLIAGLRQEDKSLYYYEFGIVDISSPSLNYVDQEYLLIDFNMEENDIIYLTPDSTVFAKAMEVDILNNGRKRISLTVSNFHYEDSPSLYWTEGIGNTSHIRYLWSQQYWSSSCFKLNENLYDIEYNSDCQCQECLDQLTETSDHKIHNKENELTIYPNPSKNNINFKIKHLDQNTNYSIYDISNQVKQTGILRSKNVNISQLGNGTYTIIITNSNGHILFTEQFLITR